MSRAPPSQPCLETARLIAAPAQRSVHPAATPTTATVHDEARLRKQNPRGVVDGLQILARALHCLVDDIAQDRTSATLTTGVAQTRASATPTEDIALTATIVARIDATGRPDAKMAPHTEATTGRPFRIRDRDSLYPHKQSHSAGLKSGSSSEDRTADR